MLENAHLKRVLLAFLSVSAYLPVHADTVVISSENYNTYIGRHLYYFVDSDRNSSLDSVLKKGEGAFTRSLVTAPGFGFTRNVVWARFSVVNESDSGEMLLDFGLPYIDSVEVFVPDEHGAYRSIKTGDLVPFEKRLYDHRNFIVPISVEKNKKTTVYARIQSDDSIMLPLRLVSRVELMKSDRITNLFFGFYYGILSIMIVYNLFLLFSLRDRNYLFYVIYLTAYFLFQASYNGLAFEFLFPGSPWLHHHFLVSITSLGVATGLIFANSFLRLQEFSPKLGRVILLYVFSCFIFSVASLFIDFYHGLILVHFIAIAGSVLTVSAAVRSYVRGYRAARFFLTGWCVFLASVCVVSLMNQGFLEYNFFTNNASMFGSVFELSLFSLALADRVTFLRREKEEAKKKIKDMENEYVVKLENQVADRTRELERERNVIRERNEYIENELNLARQIQMHMLPSAAPLDIISVLYRPMDKVGGDFFDFIRFRNDEKTGIFISDVSGHGVPAAFITSMVKSVILESGAFKDDPAKLMGFMNSIVENNTGGNFITALYGIIDPGAGSFTYCSAGHFPPFLISGKGLIELEGTGNPALGIAGNLALESRGKGYLKKKVSLPASSRLILYTDGLTEARSIESGAMFQDVSMRDILVSLSHLHGREYLDAVMAELVKFRGSETFDDDVCLICVEM